MIIITPCPIPGDTKIERKFLYFPMSIINREKNVYITKWWEYVKIQYVYENNVFTDGYEWYPIKFMEE